MTPIRVDVVIDNYNYGRFLREAIASALGQTHPDVHVVVVDDGSTDESADVLAEYADRVEVVRKENGGQASALNAGIARCRGDVVIFLDADDTLYPEIAARAADVFAREADTVQVPYRLEVVDVSGRRNGLVKPPPDMELPAGDIAAAKLTFPFDIVTVGTSGNAFRLEPLRRVAPIPETEFADCADWYLVNVMPLLGRITPLDLLGGRYRVHGANAYETDGILLDVEHVRKTIRYGQVTTGALERLSAELGLTPPYAEILSVSDLANRLISLRLEPAHHPRPGDTVPRLVADGIRASFRRWDSPLLMKLVFVTWFLLVAVAPRPLLVRLALAFLFRERRGGLNGIIRRLRNRHLRLDVTPGREP